MTTTIRRPDGALSTYTVTNPATWAPDTVEIETVED